MLDGLEEGDALFGRFEASDRGQQHRRHQGDAADPENHGQDMNSAGERYIIHEPIFAPLAAPFSPAGLSCAPNRPRRYARVEKAKRNVGYIPVAKRAMTMMIATCIAP